MKAVATIGFFDGVHRGHQHLLDQVKQVAAARQGETMVVTFARHPRCVLQPDFRPQLLTTLAEKRGFIASCGISRCEVLDFSAALSRLTAAAFIEQCLLSLGVQTLVVGYDHRFGSDRADFAGIRAAAAPLGIEVVQAQAFAEGGTTMSSSLIRRQLTAGDVEAAAEALGRAYSIEGSVVEGRRVGHRLGFPTANLQPSCAEKLIPRSGAYAVRAEIGGNVYAGMTNIGQRPTLQNGTDSSVETHLLNFAGDAYGKPLRLHFVRRLRDEQRFASLDALQQQLRHDAEAVRNIFSHDR